MDNNNNINKLRRKNKPSLRGCDGSQKALLNQAPAGVADLLAISTANRQIRS